MTTRVTHVGLGPIGAGVVRQVAARSGFEVVGAVDIDPGKVGRDVGEVCGLEQNLGIEILGDLEQCLERCDADIAVLCTGSSLASIMSQIETVLAAGLPIVSTTEELSYPHFSNRPLAQQIDDLATAAGVGVLGTGVNPGFAMDALPIALTAACERVDRVTVDRVQDAAFRRLPFQQKIGAGMDPQAFRDRVAAGKLGHVGLTESIAMIADALGWSLDRVTDDIDPKIATESVASDQLRVEAGKVAGIIQKGIGYCDGEPLIRLHMEAYLGAPESYDAVRIEGSPPLYSRIDGGIPGDVATASVVVNAIPRVLTAAPGLRTMRDVALPSYWVDLQPVTC